MVYRSEVIEKYAPSILLLKSSTIIDEKYGKQLTQLIKPLQDNQYNYRHPKFINSIVWDEECDYDIQKDADKPKLQQIICQFQHYRHYKQLKALMVKHDILQKENDDISEESE